MGDFFQELRRRNIFRVAGVYAVVGWLLAQIAVTLEAALALPVWFDGVVVTLLLLGFPVALLFAWAFEMTPEGVKRTESVAPDASITAKTGRKLDYAILIGLVLVAAFIVVDRLAPRSSSTVQPSVKTVATTDNNMVAVLPFANRSMNEEDALFADGVHDDLLTRLSKLSALQVISRTSVLRYRETDKPIPEIAAELGVAAVLEGAVQRAGDRVRINVQLIDGETDAHLWAETYDRELTAENLFEIQSEITHVIANALQAVLTGEDEKTLDETPTKNLAAYDAYLRGKLLSRWETGTSASVREAMQLFDEAIALDPNFATAHAAKAYAQLYLFWYRGFGPDWLEAARASIDRAKAIAPDAVETLIVEGRYHYWGLKEYARADAYLDRALEKAPNNAEAWGVKGFIARRDGRFDDAIEALQKAYRLDPQSLEHPVDLATTYSVLGRFDEAMAMFEQATLINGTSPVLLVGLAEHWRDWGEAERAWAVFDRPVRDPDELYYFWRFLTVRVIRDPARFKTALDDWPEEFRRPENFTELYEFARAEALIQQGKRAEADAILLAAKSRLDALADPYPAKWASNGLYFPVELPGLMGDLQGVREATEEFKRNWPADAWAPGEFTNLVFARAFARAGDPSSALDYMEHSANIFSPASFLGYSIDPAFDHMRDHPRYLALKARYENWAEETGYEPPQDE